MSRTITISDDLAALLEKRRAAGQSLDAAAEALIAQGLANDASDDHADGRTDDEWRALIAEADASGAAAEWDAKSVRAQVLKRYAERVRRA